MFRFENSFQIREYIFPLLSSTATVSLLFFWFKLLKKKKFQLCDFLLFYNTLINDLFNPLISLRTTFGTYRSRRLNSIYTNTLIENWEKRSTCLYYNCCLFSAFPVDINLNIQTFTICFLYILLLFVLI